MSSGKIFHSKGTNGKISNYWQMDPNHWVTHSKFIECLLIKTQENAKCECLVSTKQLGNLFLHFSLIRVLFISFWAHINPFDVLSIRFSIQNGCLVETTLNLIHFIYMLFYLQFPKSTHPSQSSTKIVSLCLWKKRKEKENTHKHGIGEEHPRAWPK